MSAIVNDPDVLEGQAAFSGTRIPVWVLFNYLSDPVALTKFLEAYPQISAQDAQAIINMACRALTGQTSDGDDPV